jgi:hypothetical protein
MHYILNTDPYGHAAYVQIKTIMLDLINPQDRTPQVELEIDKVSLTAMHCFSSHFLYFCSKPDLDTFYCIKAGPSSTLLEKLYIEACCITSPEFVNAYTSGNNSKNIFFTHNRYFIVKIKEICQVYFINLLNTFQNLKGLELEAAEVVKTTPSYLLIRTR